MTASLTHWRDEAGQLPDAVQRLIDHERLSIRDIIFIRNYFYLWAKHPWPGPPAELSSLRTRVRILSSEGEIRAWLKTALELGVDPL